MNARAFNAMGNGKQGLNAANQGLLMSETNSQLRQEILAEAGIAYFLLKNYSKSNESFEEALRLNAENPIVLKKYAFCLAKHNETNNRIKDIAGKIGSAAPNSSYAEAVLGFSFYAQKNYSQAAEHLQKALSKENNDPLVLEILGNTYYKSGDSAKAIHFWNAALEKLGKNADLEKMISSGKLPE
jgi:tetratricopeptide (TPR) repeat protein